MTYCRRHMRLSEKRHTEVSECVIIVCRVIGGIILHQGRIAEMRTGEGKTLVLHCRRI